MSEGELLQLQKSRKLNIKEEELLQDNRNEKTAAIISACTACGAISVTNDPDTNCTIERPWRKHRIAFQIRMIS